VSKKAIGVQGVLMFLKLHW